MWKVNVCCLPTIGNHGRCHTKNKSGRGPIGVYYYYLWGGFLITWEGMYMCGNHAVHVVRNHAVHVIRNHALYMW